MEGGDDGGDRKAAAAPAPVVVNGENVAAMDVVCWLVFLKSKWASIVLEFVASSSYVAYWA